MAENETRRIRPAELQADTDACSAIKGMADYTPSNKDYTLDKIEAAQTAMVDAQDKEVKAEAAAKAARDNATAAEWAFHNTVLGAKNQVKAQYGADSNEVQSVGLTKKSERARPGRRPPPSPAK